MTIYRFVNLAVEEIYILNVWNGGLNIKFQMLKTSPALFAELIGVKML